MYQIRIPAFLAGFEDNFTEFKLKKHRLKITKQIVIALVKL